MGSFGFGFDAVDKAFRPKQRVMLECVCCGATDDVRSEPTLHGSGFPEGTKVALCPSCSVDYRRGGELV